jgi:hypothetical protein
MILYIMNMHIWLFFYHDRDLNFFNNKQKHFPLGRVSYMYKLRGKVLLCTIQVNMRCLNRRITLMYVPWWIGCIKKKKNINRSLISKVKSNTDFPNQWDL